MGITLNAGERTRRGGGSFGSTEALSQATATTERSISLTTEVTTLAGGTATGFGVDKYRVATADAVEGQSKLVVMLATGEAKVRLGGLEGAFPGSMFKATATGAGGAATGAGAGAAGAAADCTATAAAGFDSSLTGAGV